MSPTLQRLRTLLADELSLTVEQANIHLTHALCERQVDIELCVVVVLIEHRRYEHILHATLRSCLECYVAIDAAMTPKVLALDICAVAPAEYLQCYGILARLDKLRDVETCCQATILRVADKLTIHPYVDIGVYATNIEEYVA